MRVIQGIAALFRWYYCPRHGWYYNTGDCALCVEAEGRE
jgi:hypothetical protein